MTVSTRSVAVAPSGSSPVSLKPTTCGQQHRDRLAEHARLGLDAADAPADYAQTVDHRGVRVGADYGIGIGSAVLRELVGEHDRRQVFEVDLVDDAGVRRNDAEIREMLSVPSGGAHSARGCAETRATR